MKTLIGITSLSLCLATLPLSAAEPTDSVARQETIQRVSLDPSKVLEVVAEMTAKYPASAGAIVRAAIESAKADAKLAAAIVEVALRNAPQQAALILQYALAVAPDAEVEIRAVVARLYPGVPNPLDIPGIAGAPPPAPNPPISIPTVTPPATDVGFSN